uniref:Thioredoxin domain-containing protein n=1 Tax=uncultured marine group II/III euryarchaeote AD1000_23_G03 TaxID=1457739 RepID=A0A075FS80_9EURY|nr:hypothetical protein [uncultured marine group II/III euryarchaeote AD1000_23_G03]
MRKILTLLLFAILLLPTPVLAGAPITIPNQGILGGYMIDLTNVSDSFDEFNTGGDMAGVQVVEVYTATWCENCVYSEHALMDALENESATVLVNHRFIGESQDPFGTQEGDDRWIDLYGETSAEAASGLERAAPSVVFDGHRFVAGSAPHGESLESDYAGMFADKHESRSWGLESDFKWTGDNSSGELSWSMDILPDEPELMTWRHRLMVVEHSAYFPEGSNGLEHYDDIVRAVIELNVTGNNGTAVGGEQEITLPAAYDGDDLSLVVVHEWKQTPPAIEPNPNEGPASLPGFLAPLGLIALGAAALTRRD